MQWKMKLQLMVLACLVCLGVMSEGWLNAEEVAEVKTVKHVEEADTTVQPKMVKHEDKPLIQLALLLDTSSSMNGLINQARTQLWSIVNELATTKRDGVSPRLQVALYQYGNSGLSKESGFIELKLALTEDLDKVSEALFALSTNGGQEYCGQVIGKAGKQLKWDTRKDVYKVIFIAGNEPFTQGPVTYQDAIGHAKKLGIVVNTIHCGSEGSGVSGQWDAGANLGGGIYLNIDQNQKVVHIPTPYDEELVKLNQQLNKTYLWYGDKAKKAAARQVAQDANAGQAGAPAEMQRIVAKTQSTYRNAEADLVDASKDSLEVLEEADASELPAVMREMDTEERKKFVAEKAAERAEIQKKIAELGKKRDAFVTNKRKEMAAESKEKSLGEAMNQAIRKQAEAKGFEKVAE